MVTGRIEIVIVIGTVLAVATASLAAVLHREYRQK